MPETFMDAQQALGFVVNQTFRINPTVYEIQYPDYDYARLVFVDTSSPEWSGGITTFISDKVGQAQWTSGYAKDVPLADINMAKVDKTFEMAAIGYQYNMEEVGKAAFLNIPLSNQRAMAARFAYSQFMYNLALFGNTEKNYGGLVNYSGVTAANVPNDGTGSSRLWADKTPAQIVRDINLGLTGIYTDSLTVEMADTILLPIDAMLYLGQTPYSSTTMETVMSFVQKTNVYTLTTGRPLTIRGVRGLENAGSGGTGRMVTYKNDPAIVRLHLPMPHRFLPVYQDGPFNFVIPGIFRTGGIEIHRAGAFRYLDGITA
jgi:hypothetical protein